jgi:hypothetical protein
MIGWNGKFWNTGMNLHESNVGSEEIQHKTTYDFVSLSTLLQPTGFHGIRLWNPDDELPESYDDLSRTYYPHMDETGIATSLNVEAKKDTWVL